MSRSNQHGVSRRSFLGGAAAVGAATSLASLLPGQSIKASVDSQVALPLPSGSGIEHIILVMMENRSFDHFMGWLPGANGKQAGLSYTDTKGIVHTTFHLTEFQNCDFADPDHSYGGARTQYDNGKCDGWLRAATNDVFPIGYYQQSDLSFLGQAAPDWTVCDNYFAGILGPTYPNRFYQHAAQTDRLDNATTTSSLVTIWDRLAAAGVSGRYFYNDVPFTALWGTKHLDISRPYAEFLAACATGLLPAVSYVDPRFLDEATGTSNDDHPHGDIRNGEAFLEQIYNAVTMSPAWKNTVLIINFDEWGGFFDHVRPPSKSIPPADKALGSDGRIGFRVPTLVISPMARRQHVCHTQFDHTSILKMIEWRWNLDPLTVRDAGANNLAQLLNFKNINLNAPQYAVPTGPFGGVCTSGAAGDLPANPVGGNLPSLPLPSTISEEVAWAQLKIIAKNAGFPSL